MAPTLVFVISISGGVHLMNYYRDAVRHDGLSGAPMRDVRHGWVPCLLSAGTTSLGIASLMASHLVPIQKFGTYASAMVSAGTGVLFLLVPCLLEQWPSRSWTRRLESGGTGEGWADRSWRRLASAVARCHVPLVVLAVSASNSLTTVTGDSQCVDSPRCRAVVRGLQQPQTGQHDQGIAAAALRPIGPKRRGGKYSPASFTTGPNATAPPLVGKSVFVYFPIPSLASKSSWRSDARPVSLPPQRCKSDC